MNEAILKRFVLASDFARLHHQSHDPHHLKFGARIGDASMRFYRRIGFDDGASAMLMVCGDDRASMVNFIHIADYLLKMGLCAPIIYHQDRDQGLLLIEDFGDLTLAAALDQHQNADMLYDHALNILMQLHEKTIRENPLNLAAYAQDVILQEASLLVDWFVPYRFKLDPSHGKIMQGKITHGEIAHGAIMGEYHQIWQDLMAWRDHALVPKLPQALVLRDYHAENLMMLEDGTLGLLDFQDALYGSPCYDVISLIEDARRAVPDTIQAAVMAKFLNAYPDDMHDILVEECAFWRVQRHAKVLGIFVRLSQRDGKDRYLDMLDHVQNLFESALDQHSKFKDLKNWWQTL